MQIAFFIISLDQQIDGETLLGLTERMIERLFPVMKRQVKFMKELETLKSCTTHLRLVAVVHF